MAKLDVLFTKIDTRRNPLPFLRASGIVILEMGFSKANGQLMKEIDIVATSSSGKPNNAGSCQRFICEKSALGRFGSKEFRGTRISVTRYVLRWEFRGRKYRVNSNGIMDMPISNLKRRRLCLTR
ncbi:MAG: hypothetical protein PHE24_05330 [Patescibacteria group bacterium]|nr:hypothetical protein [Patescibacteria group bacterium]